jgi:hypothetical protein
MHLVNLRVVSPDEGQPRRSIECYEQAPAIMREIGARRG